MHTMLFSGRLSATLLFLLHPSFQFSCYCYSTIFCPSSLHPPPAERMSSLPYLSPKSLKGSIRIKAAAGRPRRRAPSIPTTNSLHPLKSDPTPVLRTFCPFLTLAAAWATYPASNAWWNLVEGGVGREEWVRGEVGLRGKGRSRAGQAG